MRNVFIVLLNLLIFFFLVGIFGTTISVIGGNTVANKVLVGLIFGLFMMLVPSFLKFFKLPVSTGSALLMGVIISFIFYFASIYLFALIVVNPGLVDLGIPFVAPIRLQDATVALVFLSIVSALFSVFMEAMSRKK